MTPLQEKMFADYRQKGLFESAQKFGFEYIDTAFDRNIFPTAEALNDLKKFDEPMPVDTANSQDVINFLNRYGAPATVPLLGGRYFGFVNGGVVPAGLAAKVLGTYWDQNTAMNVISPAASKLESVVEKWLRSIFGLPDSVVAGFVNGTSMANFCGLAAARYRLLKNLNWDVNQNGFLNAPQLRVIAGKQAHSTVIKAISLLGFGKQNVQFIDTDKEGRILPHLVPELDNRTLLILQAGNVNSGSFDDFSALTEKAKAAGAWVHIDGAFGLWAQATKRLSHLTEGIQHASSWAVDGHKTLNTPYDSGIVLCNDKDAITSALHMTGGYLVLSDDRDGMFYTPEMSRRARIIELWATLKYLGTAGLDTMIAEMHERSLQFAESIKKIKGFSVLNDVVFNQVVVSCETDELTTEVIKQIQELRECWVGGSVWQERKVIRVSICSWATTEKDIEITVKSFEKALGMVKGK